METNTQNLRRSILAFMCRLEWELFGERKKEHEDADQMRELNRRHFTSSVSLTLHYGSRAL